MSKSYFYSIASALLWAAFTISPAAAQSLYNPNIPSNGDPGGYLAYRYQQDQQQSFDRQQQGSDPYQHHYVLPAIPERQGRDQSDQR